MAAEWIEYKGKKILYMNLKGLKKEAETLEVIEHSTQMQRLSSVPVLLLCNIEDAALSPKFMGHVKQTALELKPKQKKLAMVGITGLKEILLQTYNKIVGVTNQKLFDTVEQAKERLVEE